MKGNHTINATDAANESNILRLVLFCSAVVYAVMFWLAYATDSTFLLKQFAIEAVLTTIIVLWVLRRR